MGAALFVKIKIYRPKLVAKLYTDFYDYVTLRNPKHLRADQYRPQVSVSVCVSPITKKGVPRELKSSVQSL